MSKNHNNRPKPTKKSEPMNGTMKFFLAGCLAELYVLIIRRFYINGTIEAQVLWFDQYLKNLSIAGGVIFAIGVILTAALHKDNKKRSVGLVVTGAGAFLACSTLLIWWMNSTAVSLLCIIIPAVMLLGVLWNLYDKECALSLSILAAALILLWVCRRGINSFTFGIYVKIIAVAFLVLCVALIVLAKRGKLDRFLSEDADPLPVYVASGLSIVSVGIALFSANIAYYAMWVLAVVIFALAVYYTVKQL